jgi:hypothetical protein
LTLTSSSRTVAEDPFGAVGLVPGSADRQLGGAMGADVPGGDLVGGDQREFDLLGRDRREEQRSTGPSTMDATTRRQVRLCPLLVVWHW